ncbi:MAG: L,D-transpeptidase [Deltaproteobacteria bacterium]|nr:L,D-transpeptidase [Deltaproteobacteria bacterium]
MTRVADKPAGEVVFAAPDPGVRKQRIGAPAGPGDLGEFEAVALAFHYQTLIYPEPDSAKSYVGTVRRGVYLGVETQVGGKGCKGGTWYRLAGGGYGCTSLGFQVSEEATPFWIRQVQPDRSRPVPYKYGKAVRDALRYYRPPTREEQAQIVALFKSAEKGDAPKLPEVVETQMSGDFLLALDRIEEEQGRKYYRTVRGRYVRVADVQPKEKPKMRGVHLDAATRLPVAFVHIQEGAPVLKRAGRSVKTVGRSETHARFSNARLTWWGDRKVVVAADGHAIARDQVRVARAIERPGGIGPDEKWIHVHIPEQVLVAYEGDRPVMTTLVSSGRDFDGYVTPGGLYRIESKLVSTTMQGDDPKEGVYEVEEVPWTLYYHDAFAIHGAYWHDVFGNKKSHGCINVAPADARWLFYWSDPDLPAQWQSIRARDDNGTSVYITTDAVPGDAESPPGEVASAT